MLPTVFGLPITVEDWKEETQLPLFVRGSYEFNRAYIDGIRCILLTVKDVSLTLREMQIHIAEIEKIEDSPVIFRYDTINEYRRDTLIENRIAFITDRQAYIPFIGAVLLREKVRTQRKIEHFTYSAQLLFLLYLIRGQKKLYINDATKVLGYTATTLSRAVDELKSTDLFRVTKDGVCNVLESDSTRYELFEKAKDYLASPVVKTGYLDRTKLTSDMVVAAENALAEKTMLNPSENITYAVDKRKCDKTLLLDEFVDEEKQVKIEVWAYEPTLLSSDMYPDNLSLILSLKDSSDERVEGMIGELLKKELKD